MALTATRGAIHYRISDVSSSAVSDEELSGFSSDDKKRFLPSRQPAAADSDSDCEGESPDDMPFVINEIITKYGLQYVKNSLLTEISTFVEGKILAEKLEEAFYVIDLGPVFRRWGTWMRFLPRVKPHYAVKCNPNRAILGLLAALGTGFDCASSRELDLVASLGVDVSQRVIYANPCKMPGHIRHATQLGCRLTTFDTESELLKIQQLAPAMDLVLRIRADDPQARCQLGNKFGAEPSCIPTLLRKAQELHLNVVGISFHVGSGATNPQAFKEAILSARLAWDEGVRLGFQFTLLDLGGGFCGEQDMDGLALEPVAAVVNDALAEHFPADLVPGLQIIAEPGRYFAEACATLVTNVYGNRCRDVPLPTGEGQEARVAMDYWISDGLYGSMNCLVYDHAILTPKPLMMTDGGDAREAGPLFSSTLFGPTCDGLDVVCRDIKLPLLHNGDWVLFPCMGAYTMAAGSDFNGFNITEMKRYYVWSLDSGVDVDVGPSSGS